MITSRSIRWTANRKAELVMDIRRGRVTREQAIADYELTAEELDTWIARHWAFGVRGLHVTKLQRVKL